MECTRAFSNIRQATKILSCALLASCVSFSVASAEDNSGALLLGVASNGDLLVSNSGSESASSIQNLEIAASQGIRGSGIRGIRGSGIRADEDAASQGIRGSGIRGIRGSGIRGIRGSGIRGIRGSGIRADEDAASQGIRGSGVRAGDGSSIGARDSGAGVPLLAVGPITSMDEEAIGILGSDFGVDQNTQLVFVSSTGAIDTVSYQSGLAKLSESQYVAVGGLKTSVNTWVSTIVVVTPSNYLEGSTPVYMRGSVTESDPSVAVATVNNTQADYSNSLSSFDGSGVIHGAIVELTGLAYGNSLFASQANVVQEPSIQTTSVATGLKGIRGSGIRGIRGSGIRADEDAASQGIRGSGIRGIRGSGIRADEDAASQGIRGSGIR
jgi:hypothetical protein